MKGFAGLYFFLFGLNRDNYDQLLKTDIFWYLLSYSSHAKSLKTLVKHLLQVYSPKELVLSWYYIFALCWNKESDSIE